MKFSERNGLKRVLYLDTHMPNQSARYYIRDSAGERGPFVIGQLQAMWNSGAITADATYRLDGMDGWSPLAELLDATSIAPAKPAAQGGGFFNVLGAFCVLLAVWLFFDSVTIFHQIFAGIVFLVGVICLLGSSMMARKSAPAAPAPDAHPATTDHAQNPWMTLLGGIIVILLIVGSVAIFS